MKSWGPTLKSRAILSVFHLEAKERKILDQYKMGEQETNSVKAWTKVYETDEFMDAYLEKSGYPRGTPDTEKSAA